MFQNFFKTAIRNVLRNRIYTIINVTGLSIGLACAILIMLYVKDEISFDRFHRQIGQLYRVDKQSQGRDGKTHNGSYTGYFQGPRFTAKIPEIQGFVRFNPSLADVQLGTNIFSQPVCYADSNFFSVFSFPLVSGNAKEVLNRPDAVVLSQAMATKFFGKADPIGKILPIKKGKTFEPCTVTGVAKDCPENSSIKFDVLLPIYVSAETERNNDNWFDAFLSTFVVLAPGANPAAVQTKMNKVFYADASQAIAEIRRKFGISDIGMSYALEPLSSIHLGKMVPDEDEILAAKSNPVYSYVLSAIALFILLIACINFINLTVARSVKRAREIGVRKVIGGTRRQLMIQFMAESFFLCFIAFAAALALAAAALPLFSELSNKALSLAYLFNPASVSLYLLVFIVTAGLAGFYPAAVLSNYHPVQTLYSRFALSGKNYLQKSLVVFQFALASFLIIATAAIFLQFSYLTSQPLGYDDAQLMTVDKPGMTRNEAALFKQALLKNPGIVDAAPRNRWFNNNTVKVDGEKTVNAVIETIDGSLLPLLKVPIVAGRNFSSEFPSDSTQSVLVNEAFVQEAGWKQPINQRVSSFENGKSYTVIGVVRDYHFKPLTTKIQPQLFTMNPVNNYGTMYIKIKPGTETASVQYINTLFRSMFPLTPFEYSFKDQQNASAYQAEAKWKQIIFLAAVLTIFISCIGLFGLSVLAAEKRTKEIGIRKVLGASVGSIVGALSIDFLKLVLISLVLAVPFAWLAIQQWLQNYPYRITLHGWMFAGAGLLVILVAMVTISFQSVKASLANPVKSLRTE